MKYTRDDIIESARKLREACIERVNCEDCPFDDGKTCYLDDEPHSWKLPKAEEKSEKKKLVPFDFSLKEDRDALIGKVIEDKNGIYNIVSIFYDKTPDVWCCVILADGVNPMRIPNEALLNNYVFYDTGEPVGKEIEE